MRRGTFVTVVAPGDYGKPRPARIVQSDLFDEHPGVTVCLVTSEVRDAPLFWLSVSPDRENGLDRASQIMVDKVTTVPIMRVGTEIGRLDSARMAEVDRLLALWLGLA